MEFKKSDYPKKPGVYLMLDSTKKVIYVGKAKNLATRLSQYFVPGRDSRAQIPLLVAKINSIDTIVVTNEKEALLLEHTLIKKHKPRYNFLLKDDKSYICLEITDHQWPMIRWVRQKDVKKSPNVFGPYISSYAARRMLYLLQRLFPLRECSDFVLKNRTRPCILHQMKRCIAPCVHKCTEEEYQSYVDQVVQFLKGKNKSVLKTLKEKMQQASENMEYEKAAQYLETLNQIESLLEKQHVIASSSLNCDVLGLYREGDLAQLSLLSFKQGELLGSKSFFLENKIEEDPELLSSFMAQFYLGKNDLPHEILLPTPSDCDDVFEQLLSESTSHQVQLIVPQKGSKKKLIEMAYQNAEISFKRHHQKSEQIDKALVELKQKLKLRNFPETIECFDNSHLSGDKPVSAMVTFIHGKYDKTRLRKYHLNPDQVFDDLKGMEEVLLRRFKNEDLPYPDLVMVDGGKTQLKVAQKVFNQLGLKDIDLIALTKESSRHDFGLTNERVFLPETDQPITFNKHSSTLFLLQNIRDQAHKSVIGFQRKTRAKKTLKSELDDIPGIGPTKKRALLAHFKSIPRIKKATYEELESVKELNTRDIESLYQFLLKKDLPTG